MKLTFLLTVGIILFWGLWTFFLKLAVAKVSWQAVLLFSYLLSALFGLIFLLPHATARIDLTSWILIALSSLFVTLGSLLFYKLLTIQPVSIVVTFTALYPIITILLGIIFLREALTVKQIIGIIFGLVAILLINL